jgi:hypothetical protein
MLLRLNLLLLDHVDRVTYNNFKYHSHNAQWESIKEFSRRQQTWGQLHRLYFFHICQVCTTSRVLLSKDEIFEFRSNINWSSFRVFVRLETYI